MRTYTYTMTLDFEAEDDADADEQLDDWIASNEISSERFERDEWTMS